MFVYKVEAIESFILWITLKIETYMSNSKFFIYREN
jgi:hypothetical protein